MTELSPNFPVQSPVFFETRCKISPALFLVRRVKFSKRLYFKSGFIHDIFWAVLLSDNRDDCMISGFIPLHKAIDYIYSQFFKMYMNKSMTLSQ